METMAERRNRQYARDLAAKKAMQQASKTPPIEVAAPETPKEAPKASSAKAETSDNGWGLLGSAIRGLRKHKADIEQAADE